MNGAATQALSIGRFYAWARANLFNSWFSAVLTIAIVFALVRIVPPVFEWAIARASVTAPNIAACHERGGACWAFIVDWYRFLLFGRFPYQEQWRPGVVIVIFLALLLATCDRRLMGRPLAALWVIGLALVAVLMWGGILGMPYVETDLWNGLPLTLILAVGGIALSFPLALLLALGRRSSMPAVRGLCVLYIEIVRAMPFIVWLFMGVVMVPLFLPPNVFISKLWRLEIVFILFIAAYVAEVVRGGLQVIPRGQFEAAASLGLGYWRQMRLVVLPQALAISIPPLVGTFIGAFKDTALVTTVGFFDLLQDASIGMNDPNWRGAYVEAYAFVALIYFAFCYFMSRYSRYIETRLARGHR